MAERKANEIFKEFREHSIAEFFKKNKQMLGYAGMVRSMVTIVHEYVTNSLDACEDAGILPSIDVEVAQIGENRYSVMVRDNGPGIPKKFVGKALATILAGTKFHRYVQQRGQQGIGASGCTLFAQVTTGKPIAVKSYTGVSECYSCTVAIDTVNNKPIIAAMKDIPNETGATGTEVYGEFSGVKYENSDHGVYEYLKRTALANPHAQIRFKDPEGKEYTFVRSTDATPGVPKETKPHPLGLEVNDIIDFAKRSTQGKISQFLLESFSRVSSSKINELKQICGVDMEKPPKSITWDDAEKLIKAFRSMKWLAPDASVISPIGQERIKLAIKSILNPEYMHVIERKPAVFKGGIPFIVEAAIAYGGLAGKKLEGGEYAGSILRFANRVPLLFDTGSCAITQAVRSIQWKRYNIDIDNQAVSVFVNISSVYIPYSGVGKEAIAQEDEIIEEVKLALQDAARNIQRYMHGKQQINLETNKYKTIIRYVSQLSKDLSNLTGEDKQIIEHKLSDLVSEHYPKINDKTESNDEDDTEFKVIEKDPGEDS
ncbi:DNA topoisomerase VI subunit B [Candidatus Marsarchaeota archaeon]|nr:DNA topoisomerase VI subunit B [Candidatus Marsarchaeota archaeon]MCL5404959.1 DNA topoisomerase VI subunit B [Candidatus Marsarchaeota archaeon]